MKKLLCHILITVISFSSFGILSLGAHAAPSVDGFDVSSEFEVREIGDGVYLINDYGMAMCYMIVGEERCLLIDSGVGFTDFRERIEPYAQGKPITLALTHGHIDHAGASQQFEQVYLNSADNAVLWQRSVFVRSVFSFFFSLAIGGGLPPKISNSSNVDSELCEMEDGHVFDLGGRSVTFTLTPGHTKGSGCFFDSLTKLLFTGDLCSNSVLMYFNESDTVASMRASLSKVLTLAEGASAIYGGHSRSPIDIAVVNELVRMTDELLQGKFSWLPGIYVKTGKAVLADGSSQTVTITGRNTKIK